MRVGAALLLIELLLGTATATAAPPPAQQVLNAAAKAMGRLEPGTTEAHGQVEAEGRTGDYRELIRSRDGLYVTRFTYQRFGEADGYDGHVRWKQDRSAAPHVLNAPYTIADTLSLAWLRRRGYLQPGSASIERVEQEVIGGRPATVLTMRPHRGNPLRLAFDNQTH